jgi:hypothetical protein
MSALMAAPFARYTLVGLHPRTTAKVHGATLVSIDQNQPMHFTWVTQDKDHGPQKYGFWIAVDVAERGTLKQNLIASARQQHHHQHVHVVIAHVATLRPPLSLAKHILRFKLSPPRFGVPALAS